MFDFAMLLYRSVGNKRLSSKPAIWNIFSCCTRKVGNSTEIERKLKGNKTHLDLSCSYI